MKRSYRILAALDPSGARRARPGPAGTLRAPMKNLTPREIVAALDRHIIGQDAAKRAVAVAVRNRWRRQQLEPEIAREIADNTAPVSVALSRQMLWRLLGADHPMEAHKIDSRGILAVPDRHPVNQGLCLYRTPVDPAVPETFIWCRATELPPISIAALE